MFLRNVWEKFCGNERGAGLMVAVFVIVILGLFGTLLARFASIGATMAVEEYLWAQALYSAESAIKLKVLKNDQTGTAGSSFPTVIENFTITGTDGFTARGTAAAIKVKVTRLEVSREIELKYRL